MNLKKLATTMVVALALSAVMSSSALAAATEQAATWRTGSAGTVLSGSETVTATGTSELVTTVGETPLVLKSSGLECLECKIENVGGLAKGTGKLKFTGVTVSSPSTCKVNGGAVTTLSLDFTHYWMNGSVWVTVIEPVSGTTFATVKLEAGTGSCPLSGSYIVSGKDFVKATNATGVYAISQGVTASGAINSENGGELKFGSKGAELNGTGSFALSGAKKGEVFGAKE